MSAQVRTIHRVGLILVGLGLLGTAGVWARLVPVLDVPPDASGGVVVRAARPLMGSYFAISLWVPQQRRADAQLAANAVLDYAAALESQISEWQTGSDMDIINQNAGGQFVKVNGNVAELVAQMRAWSQKTNGIFDPTAGPIFELWEQARKDKALPSAEKIKTLLPLTGFQNIEVVGDTVRLRLLGMRLGTGGIGHGWAAEKMSAWLVEHGFPDHLVDGSGDIAISGTQGGTPWSLSVRHPRKKAPWIVESAMLQGGISTSGDYERFMEVNGTRYSHIIDPRTGWPTVGVISATVFAPSVVAADVLATAICAAGVDEGLALIASSPGARAFIVRDNGEVVLSKGLRVVEHRLEVIP